jgi:hypothetical protein
VRDYILHLRFADGTEGDVDLRPELEGEVFEALKEPALFQAFTLSPELHTVTWLRTEQPPAADALQSTLRHCRSFRARLRRTIRIDGLRRENTDWTRLRQRTGMQREGAENMMCKPRPMAIIFHGRVRARLFRGQEPRT